MEARFSLFILKIFGKKKKMEERKKVEGKNGRRRRRRRSRKENDMDDGDGEEREGRKRKREEGGCLPCNASLNASRPHLPAALLLSLLPIHSSPLASMNQVAVDPDSPFEIESRGAMVSFRFFFSNARREIDW